MLDEVPIHKFICIVCAGILVLASDARRAYAQASTATIVGTVTDTSEGAIPNAAVQVKNTGTGVVRSTTQISSAGFAFQS